MRSNRVVILLALILIAGAAILAFVLLRSSNQVSINGSQVGSITGAGDNTPGASGTVLPLPSPTPNTKVVAARTFLAQGTLLTEEDLQTVPAAQAGQDDILADDIGSALNHYLIAPLNKGQNIKKSNLVDGNFSTYMRQLMVNKQLEPGKKAFAYATNDLSGVAGLIHEGDLIDAVATFYFQTRPVSIAGPGGTPIPVRGSGFEPTTKTLLQNVRVLKVIQLQLNANPFSIPSRPLPTPTIDTSAQTPVVVAGTPMPTPTLLPFSEAGAYFPVTTVLILAVDDQQAELLKFTRETKIASQNCTTGGGGSSNGNSGGSNSDSGGNSTGGNGNGNALTGAIVCAPTVHFVLRSKPLDPANPQDPNVAVDPSRGVTFRALVRDYGVTIPDLVFATQAQQ